MGRYPVFFFLVLKLISRTVLKIARIIKVFHVTI